MNVSLQTVFSHLWLARFRFGPADGKAQPMRRASVPEGNEVANA